MPAGNFIKQNLVLILGLALPVALMAFFFIAATLPMSPSNPPKYDMIFSAQSYDAGANVPVSVNFLVKDGVLKAQYTKLVPPGNYNGWRKLYRYEAKTQTVRDLSFGFPADMDKIVTMREDIVEETKDLKLDNTPKSPDGYELSYDGYSHSGLVNEIFWGGSYGREPRLRNGGGSSVKISTGDSRTSFMYGNIQFLGWVTP